MIYEIESFDVSLVGPADGSGITPTSANSKHYRKEVAYVFHGADKAIPLLLHRWGDVEGCS